MVLEATGSSSSPVGIECGDVPEKSTGRNRYQGGAGAGGGT